MKIQLYPIHPLAVLWLSMFVLSAIVTIVNFVTGHSDVGLTWLVLTVVYLLCAAFHVIRPKDEGLKTKAHS